MVRGISLIYGLYLLLPIALLMVGSVGGNWTNTLLPTGITGQWFLDLWQDTSFRKAFVSSLVVAMAGVISVLQPNRNPASKNSLATTT